ncbi:hypothetical protein JCM21900_005327 [Sporobolomyces salmonicolor]
MNFPPLYAPSSGSKTKRRQGVSCDSCRLRRVRCDRLEQGGGECSECKKKGVRCTLVYVEQKSRKTRQGRLISQAKLLYGDADTPSTSLYKATVSELPYAIEGRRAKKDEWVHLQLARVLSTHLLEVYEHIVHGQIPVVDFDYFKRELGQVAGNVDALQPDMRCLSHAWAARLSDHPAITGSNPKAPTGFQDLLQPAVRSVTDAGATRDRFAKALLERALRSLDETGMWRMPTKNSSATLVVLDMLLSWNDNDRQGGRPLLSAAVEHLRINYDMRHTLSVTNDLSFWLVWLHDSVSAALGGRLPYLHEEDLALLCPGIPQLRKGKLEEQVLIRSLRDLDGTAVLALFRHVTDTARDIASLLGPVAHRQRLEEDNVRSLWAELQRSAQASEAFASSISPYPQLKNHSMVVTRDVASTRARLTFAIHRHLEQRLTQESVTEGILDDEDVEYVDSLKTLMQDSDGIFLATIHDLIAQAKSYGSHLVLNAIIISDFFPYYLDHLVAVPCIQEGGSLSQWEVHGKVAAIEWMLAALRHIGWSFPVPDLAIAENALSHLRGLAASLPPPLAVPTVVVHPAPSPSADIVVDTSVPSCDFQDMFPPSFDPDAALPRAEDYLAAPRALSQTTKRRPRRSASLAALGCPGLPSIEEHMYVGDE